MTLTELIGRDDVDATQLIFQPIDDAMFVGFVL